MVNLVDLAARQATLKFFKTSQVAFWQIANIASLELIQEFIIVNRTLFYAARGKIYYTPVYYQSLIYLSLKASEVTTWRVIDAACQTKNFAAYYFCFLSLLL